MKANVYKFAVWNRVALKSGIHALRSYMELTCENELHIFSNTKVSAAKDHGKNYMNVWLPLVRHLVSNRLFPDMGFLNFSLEGEGEVFLQTILKISDVNRNLIFSENYAPYWLNVRCCQFLVTQNEWTWTGIWNLTLLETSESQYLFQRVIISFEYIHFKKLFFMEQRETKVSNMKFGVSLVKTWLYITL